MSVQLKTIDEDEKLPKTESNTQIKLMSNQLIISLFIFIIISIISIIPITNHIINKTINNKLIKLSQKFEQELYITRSSINNNVSENIIFLKIFILNNQIDIRLARDITKSVYKWSRVYDRDPDMMLALISVESNFNPKATSIVGAEGLTQIMKFWYKVFKEPEGTFFEIEKSIEYSYKILSLLEEYYNGDFKMALIAYNRGQYAIEKDLLLGKDPSNGYATNILKIYERLKSMNIGN